MFDSGYWMLDVGKRFQVSGVRDGAKGSRLKEKA
jgi:hypothetical protein